MTKVEISLCNISELQHIGLYVQTDQFFQGPDLLGTEARAGQVV